MSNQEDQIILLDQLAKVRQPGNAIPVTDNDVLSCEFANFEALCTRVKVNLRGMDEKGRPVNNNVVFQLSYSNGTVEKFNVPLFNGYLISCRVTNESAVTLFYGQLLAWIVLKNQSQSMGQLAKGYIVQNGNLSYPTGANDYNCDPTKGFLTQENGTNPAAGTYYAYNIPTGTNMVFLSVQARLVTSATVGNRRVVFLVDTALGNVYYKVSAPNVQTASQTIDYFFQVGIPDKEIVGSEMYASIGELPLKSGNIMRVSGSNLAAGDQFSNIKLFYKRSFAL